MRHCALTEAAVSPLYVLGRYLDLSGNKFNSTSLATVQSLTMLQYVVVVLRS